MGRNSTNRLPTRGRLSRFAQSKPAPIPNLESGVIAEPILSCGVHSVVQSYARAIEVPASRDPMPSVICAVCHRRSSTAARS